MFIYYLNAACVLSLIGTFTARQVKRALSYEKGASWQYHLLCLVKDAGEVALFAFSLVNLLDYVKDGV